MRLSGECRGRAGSQGSGHSIPHGRQLDETTLLAVEDVDLKHHRIRRLKNGGVITCPSSLSQERVMMRKLSESEATNFLYLRYNRSHSAGGAGSAESGHDA